MGPCGDPTCGEAECQQHRSNLSKLAELLDKDSLAKVFESLLSSVPKKDNTTPSIIDIVEKALKNHEPIAEQVKMPTTPDPTVVQLQKQVEELLASLKTKDEVKAKVVDNPCVIVLDPENRGCKYCRNITVMCQCPLHIKAVICNCCERCHKATGSCKCCVDCENTEKSCTCCRRCNKRDFSCICCDECKQLEDDCVCCDRCELKPAKCKCCKKCNNRDFDCNCCDDCKLPDKDCKCCSDCEQLVDKCKCCKKCGVSDKVNDCTCCQICGFNMDGADSCKKCDKRIKTSSKNKSSEGNEENMYETVPGTTDCPYCQTIENSMPGQPAARHSHMIVVKTTAKNNYACVCNQCKSLWLQTPTEWKRGGIFDVDEAKAGKLATSNFPLVAQAAKGVGAGLVAPVLGKAAAVPFVAGMVAGITVWVGAPVIRKLLPYVKGFLPASIGQKMDNPVVNLIINNLGKPVEIPGFEEGTAAAAPVPDVTEETVTDSDGKKVQNLKVNIGADAPKKA